MAYVKLHSFPIDYKFGRIKFTVHYDDITEHSDREVVTAEWFGKSPFTLINANPLKTILFVSDYCRFPVSKFSDFKVGMTFQICQFNLHYMAHMPSSDFIIAQRLD